MESRTRPLQAPPTAVRASARRRELAHAGLVWVDITQPTAAEVTHLRERFRLDPLVLSDVLSTLQRPKLDVFAKDEYIFVILHVPVLDRDNRIVASEIEVFAGSEFFISVHDGDLRPMRRIFAAAATDEPARAQLMTHGAGYLLYRVIDTVFKQVFPIVYRIDDDLARLDARATGVATPALVRELADLRRDVTVLRHMLGPNIAVVHALEALDYGFLKLDTTHYFGDCADLLDKLIDLLDEQQDSIQGLSATLDQLIMQRNGQMIGLLVVFSLVALPFLVLAAVASLYRVAPVLDQPIGFAVALLATIAVVAAGVWYARSRQWL